ncbi:TetR/AcrR family transcriptional regulator [Shewanella xiamenensis]|uniref:TetR/AcrR family transcriptional regulator n=2 Tax=Shewanella decolorationis TaxID=256839 RepID=A0A5B8R0X9_9GAMM|nr:MULTISPECIES: TetR/AcrR family transcriptional regulator [Shewanella]ASF17369.1 TetR/AcrR family transcriptional regulator [Shewanella sp. FDAARGOS_354]ESE40735.1 TetR family transcriptional regulator [Shewanella decolorationis S12]MDH1627902.1 TetR/AcrR family transcriptional regulator [Shewanella xiamenensis]MDI5876434.1 TetR/AcrR family transcriptional regulator [Shewanella xiamenensis]MDV5245774.1 TetR/AcrR family transcriptional regulator [Shewanella xiamenensis]
MMSTVTQTPCVGRPRAFDADDALAKALEVFWRKGFEGTSLTDLTQAMGINKPSLYAAFGNKEQLFLKAIELYEQRPCAFFYPSLEKETAYQVVESMLYGAASSLVDESHPQGCLIVQGALACSEAGQAIKETLITRRRDGEQALCERLQRAKDEGDLPADADPLLLSRYIGTVLQGMAVQATNGICPEELRKVAELVLANFPKNNP